ncbi:MAG: membrane bound O-acyl transferase family-domain-containing protein [Gemmatimonadota bacterium]
MASYIPSTYWVAALLAACLVVVLVAGYVMGRYLSTGIARALAWSTLVFGTLGIERVVSSEPPGVRMVALITFALIAMKVIVVIEERARGMQPLSPGMWFGFAGVWIGMRPRLFAAAGSDALRGAGALVRRGTMNAVTGAVLVALAWIAWTGAHSRLLATVLLLPGLSLLVHFGLCNLLAGAWRWRGVACEALFRAPLRSQSLGEFWARRWNVAFSEMTTIAAYRPLADRIGRGPAVMAGFALSGLLHEMAISVPVRAGFGLPLLYFLVHGGLVLVERALTRAGYPLSGWVGRAWVMFWVLAPLPILFHRPFLAGIIWPLIGIPPNS